MFVWKRERDASGTFYVLTDPAQPNAKPRAVIYRGGIRGYTWSVHCPGLRYPETNNLAEAQAAIKAHVETAVRS